MLKLTIELVPSTSWCVNLRSIISDRDWDMLRKQAYRNNKHKCEICNGSGLKQGFSHPVECHEIWDYDDLNHIQTLIGLISLCPLCHKAKHYGRTIVTNDRSLEVVNHHIRYINDMSIQELNEYIHDQFKIHRERSSHLWTINLEFINLLLGRPYEKKDFYKKE